MTAPNSPVGSRPPASLHGSGNPYEIVISSGRTERVYWQDLWRYRGLLLLLAYRNVSVLYKQTAIGAAWAIVRPLSSTLILVLVFSKVARLPSDGLPYPLIVVAGMLPWQLFASALTESSNSLVGNANLVSKVYFPRLIVPLSALFVAVVDLLVALPILAILMIVYGTTFTWRLALFPLFAALALFTAFGFGLWLSALNVRYRDVRYAIPFVVQFGLYLSPVGYATSVIPQDLLWLYSLNPLVAVIDGTRWSLLGASAQSSIGTPSFYVSILGTIVIVLSGVRYFRRMERTFADAI